MIYDRVCVLLVTFLQVQIVFLKKQKHSFLVILAQHVQRYTLLRPDFHSFSIDQKRWGDKNSLYVWIFRSWCQGQLPDSIRFIVKSRWDGETNMLLLKRIFSDIDSCFCFPIFPHKTQHKHLLNILQLLEDRKGWCLMTRPILKTKQSILWAITSVHLRFTLPYLS